MVEINDVVLVPETDASTVNFNRGIVTDVNDGHASVILISGEIKTIKVEKIKECTHEVLKILTRRQINGYE